MNDLFSRDVQFREYSKKWNFIFHGSKIRSARHMPTHGADMALLRVSRPQQDLARQRRRKRKPRDYQANYRAKLAEAKTPERNDVAAVLMALDLDVLVIDHKAALAFSRPLVEELVADDYDRQASMERIGAMARRVRARMQAKDRLTAME